MYILLLTVKHWISWSFHLSIIQKEVSSHAVSVWNILVYLDGWRSYQILPSASPGHLWSHSPHFSNIQLLPFSKACWVSLPPETAHLWLLYRFSHFPDSSISPFIISPKPSFFASVFIESSRHNHSSSFNSFTKTWHLKKWVQDINRNFSKEDI